VSTFLPPGEPSARPMPQVPNQGPPLVGSTAGAGHAENAPPQHTAVPALPAGPVGGTPRQWEARARRMVLQGHPRDELIAVLVGAGWPFDQAQAMVTRLASKARWGFIGTIIATGCIGALGVVIVIVGLNARGGDIHGGGIAFSLFGIVGFIYGLVGLTKIRA
jgi:hypothetical protein